METSEYELLNRRETTYFWHVGRREILREALRRHVGAASEFNILDIGCATGGNIFLLREFGNVTGLDCSDDALVFARRRGVPRLIKADATSIPQGDGAFDMITGLDIFEHVEDDERALREAFRVLKPGGIFLVTVPAYPWLFSAHDKFLHHVRRYARADMVQKCQRAGFSVLEDSHFVTLGVPMNALRKFRDRILYGDAMPVQSYDIIFNRLINAWMLALLRFEKFLIRFFPLPFGTSLLIVMRKPEKYAREQNPHVFLRSDFWKAFVAGAAIAVLSLPVLENLNVFDSDPVRRNSVAYLILWFILLPMASALGLYGVYRMSARQWPVLFAIGKYGIIGWLNTFLSIGIFNFFVLLTGVAKGWTADAFIAASFAITVTHSFFWNKFWIFGARRSIDARLEYIRFFAVTGATAVLNTIVFHIIVNTMGAPAGIDSKLWANAALAVLIPISFFGNFLGYRIFVFKKTHVSR